MRTQNENPLLSGLNSGRVPSERLRKRGDMECYAIVHFGLNTYADKEWGYGDLPPELFNPSSFDADAIVRTCLEAGLSGLILVCKHHDGFCLWPTETTSYSVASSPWRDGKGDMVREFSEACARHHMKIGFYVSPWDRNHPAYGTAEYPEIFRRQLREVYTRYGEAFELWFDGANGGDGYYGGAREKRSIDRDSYYDWPRVWKMARELQPNALIFSDIGPDLRWVGNEKGFAAEDCFGCFTPRMPEGSGGIPCPGSLDSALSSSGDADGLYYIPPECDVPLRRGWFYHKSEDAMQRGTGLLIRIYLSSVGCGGFLNLGIAPGPDGRLHPADIAALRAFHEAREALFASPVFRRKRIPCAGGACMIEFGNTVSFNLLEMAEEMERGELVSGYVIELRCGGMWKIVQTGRAIGRKRLKYFRDSLTGDALRIRITESRGEVRALFLACYDAPAEFLNASASDAPDPRNTTSYRKLGAGTGTDWVYDLGENMRFRGFIFTPDPALPPGTPDRYVFAVGGDGKIWTEIAEGEFSNLRANPVPQLVEFPAVDARFIRFSATRMLIPAENISGVDFGILLQ